MKSEIDNPEFYRLFHRFLNTYHAMAGDDWNDRASDILIKKHYDAQEVARAELLAYLQKEQAQRDTLKAQRDALRNAIADIEDCCRVPEKARGDMIARIERVANTALALCARDLR
jgi:hypothetical protein